MLDTIRSSARGAPGKIIVGLIVITFVLFGAESIVSIAGNSAPAVVNGDDISETDLQRLLFQRQQELAQQFGPEFAAQLANSAFLREEVINTLVNQVLQNQIARNLGFTVSEEQILENLASIETFQVDGRFDQNTYLRLLTQAGYTHQSYLAEEQTRTALGQFQAGLIDSTFSINKLAQRGAALENQLRSFAFLALNASDFEQNVDVTESEIELFYSENSAQYLSEEQVQLKYVLVSQASTLNDMLVTDSELERAYQSYVNLTETTTNREISHILFAEKQDNRAAAEAALVRLNAGESFEELARELSDDPGSAAFGGGLGTLVQGVFVEEFYRAAAALSQAGEVSGLVETDFGLHIIRLDDIVLSQAASFEEKRIELEETVRLRKARDEMILVESALADAAFTNDLIEDLAAQFETSVQSTDWVTRDSVDPLTGEASFQEVAFSDQVIFDGLISNVARMPSGDLVVVQRIDYQPADVLPLDSVRSQIEADLRREAALKAMQAELEAVAQSGADYEQWVKVESVSRRSSDAPQAVVRKAFAMPNPASKANFDFVTVGTQGYVVALLDVNSIELEASQIAQIDLQLQQSAADTQYQVMFNGVRANADVKVRQ